jgi:hypothetical protein
MAVIALPEWIGKAAASAGVGLGVILLLRLVQFSLKWAKVRRGLKGVWTSKNSVCFVNGKGKNEEIAPSLSLTLSVAR